ncbi:MAG: PPC domain-containing protein [Acidimicrobiaceae bacterium]|nr:PPC domain-containing protein [Acidimicrobiaceae bacterium]
MSSTQIRKSGMSIIAMAGLTVALLAGMLTLVGSNPAMGNDDAQNCVARDLGTLENTEDSTLETEGRWTTEDCDSYFRVDSDAHTYKFQVTEPGRARINLISEEGDAYLYLLAGDGRRIADDDDSGHRLNARIEEDLVPGVYIVEATTASGRRQGPADFTLTISRVKGCAFAHLGTLEPGKDLTTSDSWTLDTCGSRFVAQHPAHGYSFDLVQDGRVLIDLESENGDPVLSLVSSSGAVIGANDDGGEYRNSRIEQYLQAGVYFIEATTYLERDHQPLQADFILTIHFVDEQARQRDSKLKIEKIHTPEQVVAGDSFNVHYRVGNAGGSALPDGSHVAIYIVGRSVFESTRPSRELWQPGVSYHTSSEAANVASISNDKITPFEITINTPGPTWVVVIVIVRDANGEEIGYHRLWHNLTVHSSSTFSPVTVQVNGTEYTVSATADIEGQVTTSVNANTDADTDLAAEISPLARAQAIYTAGVHTQLLNGIFERPAIAVLQETTWPRPVQPSPISVVYPSSGTLLNEFGQRYSTAVDDSGLADTLKKREAISSIAAEKLLLDLAETAYATYVPLASSWRTLLRQTEDGETLTFAEASNILSQLTHVENLITPMVIAGNIVTAARAAELGWEDPAVQEMIADQINCKTSAPSLNNALRKAGIDNANELLALDIEMRAALPAYGSLIYNILCETRTADGVKTRFLERLSIGDSDELTELLSPEEMPAPAPKPVPYSLRIIAQHSGDDRIEHGVELANGHQILLPEYFSSSSAPVSIWQISEEIEVAGNPIGRIRIRRLTDGRIEMGFISVNDQAIVPNIAYLPADLPVGVWFRSSEISVPRTPLMDAGTDENG